MPYYQGTRRVLLAATHYPSKTFISGIQQLTWIEFSFSSAVALYDFQTGVNGGSPTQWYMMMNPGSSISPSDNFSFGYDGFNTAQYWFSVDGMGSGSGTQVSISSTDTKEQVCDALAGVASTPGFYQSSSDTMSYNSTALESQSTPSDGNYGDVTVVNSGSNNPGGSAKITFYASVSSIDTPYYFWTGYSGASDPGGPGSGTSLTTLNGNYTASDLASLFANGVNGSVYSSYMNASVIGPGSTTVQIVAQQNGLVSNGDVSSGLNTIQFTQQTNGYGIQNWPSSPYILTTDPVFTQTYYVWCSVDGSGSDPAIGDHGSQAALNSSDNESFIASTIGQKFQDFGTGMNIGASAGFVTLQAGNIGPSTPSTGVNPPFAVTTPTTGVINVNTTTNACTVTNHGYPTGLSVRLTTTSQLPAGLSLNTTYYIIRVNANTLKFATSLANALAGTAVDLTDAGFGSQTIRQYP